MERNKGIEVTERGENTERETHVYTWLTNVV